MLMHRTVVNLWYDATNYLYDNITLLNLFAYLESVYHNEICSYYQWCMMSFQCFECQSDEPCIAICAAGDSRIRAARLAAVHFRFPRILQNALPELC
jgi:hypothetical protein